MEFRIQYFGEYDRLLCTEQITVDVLDIALARARAIVYERDPSFTDPAITGYVISMREGREGVSLLEVISGRKVAGPLCPNRGDLS
jgi:hypothetical protein